LCLTAFYWYLWSNQLNGDISPERYLRTLKIFKTLTFSKLIYFGCERLLLFYYIWCRHDVCSLFFPDLLGSVGCIDFENILYLCFVPFLCLGRLNAEEAIDIEEYTEWKTSQQVITTCLFWLLPHNSVGRPNPNSPITDLPSQPAAPIINWAPSLTKF